jgi:hypothetical protein
LLEYKLLCLVKPVLLELRREAASRESGPELAGEARLGRKLLRSDRIFKSESFVR